VNRAAILLLSIGTALFIALLAWQGLGSVTGALAAAGWGLVLVAAFHVVPLALDAAAIAVLFGKDARVGVRDALFARWSGESVNSLLPAGQIGGPVAMVRQLAQRGMAMGDAAAAITVSTTVQAVAQIAFAVFGIALFSMYAANSTTSGGTTNGGTTNVAPHDLGLAALIATGVLAGLIALFYVAQRRGLFGRVMRLASKVFGKRDWSSLATRADAVDAAVRALYDERGRVAASFALSFVGWLVGTAEVWLALRFLGHPVGWIDALLLESIGQAIRGAAFAIPGSLGVQEGGYLLLAPLVGLPPEAALALSLAKRAREILLGLPGLLYLHFSERSWQRRRAVRVAAVEIAD
jgi:putative membrane protein